MELNPTLERIRKPSPKYKRSKTLLLLKRQGKSVNRTIGEYASQITLLWKMNCKRFYGRNSFEIRKNRILRDQELKQTLLTEWSYHMYYCFRALNKNINVRFVCQLKKPTLCLRGRITLASFFLFPQNPSVSKYVCPRMREDYSNIQDCLLRNLYSSM